MTAYTRDMLDEMATKLAEECFKPEYCTVENLNERKIDGLGKAISYYAHFDGTVVMEILIAALTDCNYHKEAGKVQEMLDALS